jgi:DNA modification methylase
MSSSISHSIKKREKANDVFITPLDLSKKQIDMIEYNEGDIWFDPFKNSGSYYNQFPNEKKNMD